MYIKIMLTFNKVKGYIKVIEMDTLAIGHGGEALHEYL